MEVGEADLLEQEFRGRGKIATKRSLSYLGSGPFEAAFRLRWIDRLKLVLAVLLGIRRQSPIKPRRFQGAVLHDVSTIPSVFQDDYSPGPVTVHLYDGGTKT